MRYLIPLALLAFAALLVYWRLRPYIHFARRALGFVRDARRLTQQDFPGPAPRRASTERLVRCSSCGTWLPASRALAARSSSEVYCSTDCLEGSARGDSSPRALGDKF